MLDPTERRKYIFAALDYDLDDLGPEGFTCATAYNLASNIWHNDPMLPAEIKNAEQIEGDVQAWLDLHPDLPTAKQLSVDYSKIKPFVAPYGEPSAK